MDCSSTTGDRVWDSVIPNSLFQITVIQKLYPDFPLWFYSRDKDWYLVKTVPAWRNDPSRYVFSHKRPTWTPNQ